MSSLTNLDLDTWQQALETGSFEDATSALDAVVACLERGQLRLDDALSLYDLGVKLAHRCDADLTNAELRVTRLMSGPVPDSLRVDEFE